MADRADDFLDLTYTASAAEVIVSWDYPDCWGLVQDYTVEVKPYQATAYEVYEVLGAEATSFAVSDCAILGMYNKYQVTPTLPDGVASFTKGPFSLGKDYSAMYICTIK